MNLTLPCGLRVGPQSPPQSPPDLPRAAWPRDRRRDPTSRRSKPGTIPYIILRATQLLEFLPEITDAGAGATPSRSRRSRHSPSLSTTSPPSWPSWRPARHVGGPLRARWARGAGIDGWARHLFAVTGDERTVVCGPHSLGRDRAAWRRADTRRRRLHRAVDSDPWFAIQPQALRAIGEIRMTVTSVLTLRSTVGDTGWLFPDFPALEAGLAGDQAGAPNASLLKRGELVLEASHRIAVQEGCPAHPGHVERGQLRERRRLRQAYDVHRGADLGGEAAQRVRLP